MGRLLVRRTAIGGKRSSLGSKFGIGSRVVKLNDGNPLRFWTRSLSVAYGSLMTVSLAQGLEARSPDGRDPSMMLGGLLIPLTFEEAGVVSIDENRGGQ